VLTAVAALRASDADALGALLYASHASLRDDYAVSCRELDAVVEIAREVPGVVGARMMGAGFGGNVLALVRRPALSDLQARLAAEYPRRTGRVGELRVCQIGGGPRYATVARD
jgi:galactokinase